MRVLWGIALLRNMTRYFPSRLYDPGRLYSIQYHVYYTVLSLDSSPSRYLTPSNTSATTHVLICFILLENYTCFGLVIHNPHLDYFLSIAQGHNRNIAGIDVGCTTTLSEPWNVRHT